MSPLFKFLAELFLRLANEDPRSAQALRDENRILSKQRDDVKQENRGLVTELNNQKQRGEVLHTALQECRTQARKWEIPGPIEVAILEFLRVRTSASDAGEFAREIGFNEPDVYNALRLLQQIGMLKFQQHPTALWILEMPGRQFLARRLG